MSEKSEQEIVDLQNQWMDAWLRRDEGRLREILADDFLLTSALSTGDLIDKNNYLIAAMTTHLCKSFRYEKMNVRFYDDVAIVNSLYTQDATMKGQDWSGIFLLTDVWVKRNGQWQVVTRHSSRPVN